MENISIKIALKEKLVYVNINGLGSYLDKKINWGNFLFLECTGAVTQLKQIIPTNQTRLFCFIIWEFIFLIILLTHISAWAKYHITHQININKIKKNIYSWTIETLKPHKGNGWYQWNTMKHYTFNSMATNWQLTYNMIIFTLFQL